MTLFLCVIPVYLYTLKLLHMTWKITGKHIYFFHIKAADILHSRPIWPAELSPPSILKDWDTNSKKIPMTDTTANKCHVKLQNIALRQLKSFEKQEKDNFMRSSTTLGPGGCNTTASEGYSSRHCYSSCPGQHPLLDPLSRPWILLALSFQWIKFPRKRFFPRFCNSMSMSQERFWEETSENAKWNLLLIFNFNLHWICSWRKNRACAPFPSAEIKALNQKVECGRKGEDGRFVFKLKNLHIFT